MNATRSSTTRRVALRTASRLAVAASMTASVVAGSLSFAPPASAAVVSPSSVGGVGVNATTLQVQWTDNSTTENRYSVRLTDTGTGQLFMFDAAAVPASGTRGALTVTDLAAGHAYRPTVCSMSGPGTFSATCAQGGTIGLATTTAAPPATAAVSAPAVTSVLRIGASTVRVNWNHPGNASGFRVYVRVANGGSWMLASTGPGTDRSTTVTPLLVDTQYQLAVCAVNANNQNVCSNAVPVYLAQGF